MSAPRDGTMESLEDLLTAMAAMRPVRCQRCGAAARIEGDSVPLLSQAAEHLTVDQLRVCLLAHLLERRGWGVTAVRDAYGETVSCVKCATKNDRTRALGTLATVDLMRDHYDHMSQN